MPTDNQLELFKEWEIRYTAAAPIEDTVPHYMYGVRGPGDSPEKGVDTDT